MHRMKQNSVKVKICGLMTEEDCRIVGEAGADFAGFVFAKTRHFVSDETAAALRSALAPGIPAVGVFVDDDIDHIASLVRRGIIQLVQLHGHEDAAYIASLRERLAEIDAETCPERAEREKSNAHPADDTELCASGEDAGRSQIPRRKQGDLRVPQIIRAVRVRDGSEILPAEKLPCDCLLLDTWVPDAPGGSGKRFDLSLVPGELGKPWFLAGGLTPENIGGVLKQVFADAQRNGCAGPFAVDVSSGVEMRGAVIGKDREKVLRFMKAVRSDDPCP